MLLKVSKSRTRDNEKVPVNIVNVIYIDVNIDEPYWTQH